MISAKELLYIYLAIILTALLASAMMSVIDAIEDYETRIIDTVSKQMEKVLKEHIDGCS